jgi:hypothetical protein
MCDAVSKGQMYGLVFRCSSSSPLQSLERSGVLIFEATGFQMPTPSWNGPYPAINRFLGTLPAGFQNFSNTRSHGQDTTRRRRFSVCDQEGSAPTVGPRYRFPFQSEAFIRSKARIDKDRGDLGQEFGRRCQVTRLFLYADHVFPMMPSGQHSDSRHGANYSPLDR